ncbi:pentapeptide repeat-containing protein [Paenibacillus sp. GCM10027626]|uniref:pentapeptide repeat-containing protein n=1 Tax=Paenibacillus sp. GCM10027626 TaxID=3273411 RepID=UPI0036445818
MNKKQMIARWDAEQLAEANQALGAVTGKQNLHKKDRSFPSSPFGQTDAGLEDFRGAVLTETIQYLTVQKVDLSYARFVEAASLNTSKFTNCCFDGVKLDGRYVTRQFSHCSFRGANLNNASISEQFEDCDFTGSTLRKAKARDVSFIRCSFTDVKFHGVMLMHCRFEECSFEGAVFHFSSLAGSRFTGETDLLPVWGDTIVDGVKINGEALA